MPAGMKGIVDEQHLFNLYVHLPPNKTLEGPATIFNGHEIPGSIQTGARTLPCVPTETSRQLLEA